MELWIVVPRAIGGWVNWMVGAFFMTLVMAILTGFGLHKLRMWWEDRKR